MEFTSAQEQRIKNLALTLKRNCLASSEAEAIKTAQAMLGLGTQTKVQTELEKKPALSMDQRERARKERDQIKQREQEMQKLREKEVKSQGLSITDAKKANIERMRLAAVESKPVIIQNHFDTPLNDQRTLSEITSKASIIDQQPEPQYEPEPEGQPETTIEIPARPSVIRPKESFAESQIDLTSMFNFGAR
jgi:hypothetical protein